MLKFLRRVLQLEGCDYAKIAMLQCIADEAAEVKLQLVRLAAGLAVQGVLGRD
jgi:hypothetical protein